MGYPPGCWRQPFGEAPDAFDTIERVMLVVPVVVLVLCRLGTSCRVPADVHVFHAPVVGVPVRCAVPSPVFFGATGYFLGFATFVS